MDTLIPPAFGGIIKEPDPRDYNLQKVNEALGGSFISVRSNNDYSSIPVDFQGQQPACGAHAGAMFKNIQSLRDALANKHSSPRYAWTKIKRIDSYRVEDGTDINSIFKVLRNSGVCRYDLTGNDVTLPLQAYANLAITQDMDTEASENQTEAEAFTYSPTWQQICQNIDLHGGCVVLFRCGQNMYKTKGGASSWAEADILPLSPSNYPMDSGHFVCATNYDDNYIYFRNSWGTSWGRNGDGYFGRDYMPFVNAIAVAVDKKKVPTEAIPVPAPIIVNGQVVNWYARFVAALKNLGLFGKGGK